MSYDITKPTAPKMPTLGKGTECIKILLSQTSKDMHEPLVPMLFPILGAHISGSEFQYPDLSWKELCGQMANLVAESGGNKGQLSQLVEAICRDFRQHDVRSLPPRFHRGKPALRKKSPKMPRYRTASSAIARVPVGDAVFLHRLLKAAPSTCICRLPEPSRAHSRDQHVQTREAAKPSKDSRGICLTQKCVAFNEVNPQKSLNL